MRQFDKNKDGELDIDEFTEAFSALTSKNEYAHLFTLGRLLISTNPLTHR